jgi:hypothetical protein
MKQRDCRWRRGATLFVSLVLLSFALRIASRSAPPAPLEQPSSMIGTVHRVDTDAGILEVITGVGHAIRLVRMKVSSDCRIHISGATPHLANVAKGTMVRIQYVPSPSGTSIRGIAMAIESVESDGPGGAR